MNNNYTLKQSTAFILLMIANLSVWGQNGVRISPKVYLQGALHGLPVTETLMKDGLREKGLLPTTEPYSLLPNFQHVNGGGGEMVTDSSLFLVTGPDAIVDWVAIELRSPVYLDETVATRSALVQRDGDVVDVDGTSSVFFENTPPGTYHVVVRHRNHLGAMSTALALNEVPLEIDFTVMGVGTSTCGNNGMALIGEKYALWGGDTNRDGRLIPWGPGNDVLPIFLSIVSNVLNTSFSNNFISFGYHQSDANMDGFTILSGPGNDKSIILWFILNHFTPNYNLDQDWVILECVP